jgi:hypothetical protein
LWAFSSYGITHMKSNSPRISIPWRYAFMTHQMVSMWADTILLPYGSRSLKTRFVSLNGPYICAGLNRSHPLSIWLNKFEDHTSCLIKWSLCVHALTDPTVYPCDTRIHVTQF